MKPRSLTFRNTLPNVIDHPIEKRGFVSVPLDYQDSTSEEIEVFYRLIPASGSSADDSTKPIIVVMNGGPGFPSSVYRPVEFDYLNLNSETNGDFDRFKFILRTHRVLLVDQRGTDGFSAPIKVENPNLDYHAVARYFSSDSQARDYLAVINHVIPPGEPFFVIAQSYGGMPGMQYLSIEDGRRPNGIVFSCAGLPYENFMEHAISRRREQYRLNIQLRECIPNVEQILEKVRKHFEYLGISPIQIHGLYTFLGKGLNRVWELALLRKLEKLLTQSRSEIESEDIEKFGEVNLLNYILSSCNFTPGYTDRTLAREVSKQIPFESWMLDENEIYLRVGQDGTWRGPLVEAIDSEPPPATLFASIEDLRAAISRNQVLFTSAENDAFVPEDAYHRAIEKYKVPFHTECQHLPGGHHAIFLEEGHKALLEWSQKLLGNSSTS